MGLYALYSDAYKSYYPNQLEFRKGFTFLLSTTLNNTSHRFSSSVPIIYIRIEFDPMSLGVSCIRSDLFLLKVFRSQPHVLGDIYQCFCSLVTVCFKLDRVRPNEP